MNIAIITSIFWRRNSITDGLVRTILKRVLAVGDIITWLVTALYRISPKTSGCIEFRVLCNLIALVNFRSKWRLAEINGWNKIEVYWGEAD